jgi:hypothetical protein
VNEKCSGKIKIKQVNIFLKRENIIFNEGILYEFFQLQICWQIWPILKNKFYGDVLLVFSLYPKNMNISVIGYWRVARVGPGADLKK